jgi:hypothetical protein
MAACADTFLSICRLNEIKLNKKILDSSHRGTWRRNSALHSYSSINIKSMQISSLLCALILTSIGSVVYAQESTIFFPTSGRGDLQRWLIEPDGFQSTYMMACYTKGTAEGVLIQARPRRSFSVFHLFRSWVPLLGRFKSIVNKDFLQVTGTFRQQFQECYEYFATHAPSESIAFELLLLPRHIADRFRNRVDLNLRFLRRSGRWRKLKAKIVQMDNPPRDQYGNLRYTTKDSISLEMAINLEQRYHVFPEPTEGANFPFISSRNEAEELYLIFEALRGLEQPLLDDDGKYRPDWVQSLTDNRIVKRALVAALQLPRFPWAIKIVLYMEKEYKKVLALLRQMGEDIQSLPIAEQRSLFGQFHGISELQEYWGHNDAFRFPNNVQRVFEEFNIALYSELPEDLPGPSGSTGPEEEQQQKAPQEPAACTSMSFKLAFKVLDVDRCGIWDQIRAAYKRQMRLNHPGTLITVVFIKNSYNCYF